MVRPLVVVPLLFIAACGGESEEEKAAKAATTYYAALASGNAAAMCATLSVAAKESLKADVAKLGGCTICTKAAARAAEVAATFVGVEQLKTLASTEPTEVEIEGDSARARVGSQFVSFAREPEGWKGLPAETSQNSNRAGSGRT